MADPHTDRKQPDASPPAPSLSGATGAAVETPTAPDAEAQLERRLSEIETRIEKLAERFDQLEFVIVEQFEPGMTSMGDIRPGNLRQRLDRIEAMLKLLSQSGEERPAPAEPSLPSPGEEHWERAAALSAETAAAHAQRLGVVEARLEGLLELLDGFADEARGRHDDLLGAFERALQRPMPAPDLTAQHRSFAGFAAALQVTLDRLDGAVEQILTGFASMAAQFDTLQTRTAPEDELVAEASQVESDLGAGLGALCDRIGALTDVIAGAADRRGSVEMAALSDRLDALGEVLPASLGDAAVGQRAAMEETLRDLRIAVAEVAAENRRLQIA